MPCATRRPAEICPARDFMGKAAEICPLAGIGWDAAGPNHPRVKSGEDLGALEGNVLPVRNDLCGIFPVINMYPGNHGKENSPSVR